MLELMISAVVGGVVETLSGLAINQSPAVARRIQQTAGLVEKQPPTAMSAAIRRAGPTPINSTKATPTPR